MASVAKAGNRSGLSYLRARYLRRIQVLSDNSQETAEFHSTLFEARRDWNEAHPRHPIHGVTMPPNWELPDYAAAFPAAVLLPPGLEQLDQEHNIEENEDYADWYALIELFRDAVWMPALFPNPWHAVRHPLDLLVSAWLLYDPRTISATALDSLVPEFSLKPVMLPYPLDYYIDPETALRVKTERDMLMGVIMELVGKPDAITIFDEVLEKASSMVEQVFPKQPDRSIESGIAVLPIVPAMSAQDVIAAAPEMASLAQEVFHRQSIDNIVRELRNDGVPSGDIARLLGIDESTVSRAGR